MIPGRGTLLMYGASGFPLALLGLPLYIYLPTYYAEDLGLGLAATGGILLLVRLFDLLTDPLIGHLSDRLNWHRSRRRSSMWLGMPLLLLGAAMLLQPAAGAGSGYLLGWSLLTFLGWTLIAIPHTAWGAEIASDPHQRSRLSVAREGFVIVGTLTALALPFLAGTTGTTGETLSILATVLLISLPITLVLTLFVPERPPRPAHTAQHNGLQALYHNRPLRRLLLGYFLNNLANALPATLFLLFVNHRLQAPEWTGTLLLVYFASGVLALPLWLALARRRGKVYAWSLSMTLASVAFLAVPLLGPGDIQLFLLVCLISGLSLGADTALPASLQADVGDIDHRLSGRQRTGLLYGLWGVITKLALALAVGIAFPLLELAGFEAGSPPADSALLALSLLYGLVPVVLKLGCLILLRGFTLEGERNETLPHSTAVATANDPAHKRMQLNES